MLALLLFPSAEVGLARGKYNCLTRELWSEEKAAWCCEVRGLGCPPASATKLAAVNCDAISDQEKCDASGCSWCKAGAVPDSCKTIEEAKQLPSAVFQCDNIESPATVASS
ncbi:hypothetical protein AB1Y20_019358 [Prymnesium parvum]|uniref:PSI domain-containing protein n=1 Tax=Prymnesium parvum TaxID=97485 RepID=A0AB34JS83_PRYPA|mmetsp:Transcript_22120/g.53090  ORF Transcript_22120/g.53090 Transcript_22120/m.53090 type:complete len:111 (-) Transcript_22120:1322-1654(-)